LAPLRHVSSAEPGLARRGRGFVYLDDRQEGPDPAVLERIRALAIPPASASRPIVNASTSSRLVVRVLPPSGGVRAERLPVPVVVAADPDIEYAEGNGTHGLTTLERVHVQVDGDGILLFYHVGKGGKRHRQQVADRRLVEVGAELKRWRRGDARFLAYRSGCGWETVSSEDVNAFPKELAGEQFSATDFRTWHATVLGAVGVAAADEPCSGAAEKRTINDGLAVAESLGNTPAVCRASHVDPRVFDAFRDGRHCRPGARAPQPVPQSTPLTLEQVAVERAVRRLMRAH